MTKAEIVSNISEQLGIDKGDVQATVEKFMEEVKSSLEGNENVYLRGFGSFVVKTRAEKTGRNISKNITAKDAKWSFSRKDFEFSLKINSSKKNFRIRNFHWILCTLFG